MNAKQLKEMEDLKREERKFLLCIQSLSEKLRKNTAISESLWTANKLTGEGFTHRFSDELKPYSTVSMTLQKEISYYKSALDTCRWRQENLVIYNRRINCGN